MAVDVTGVRAVAAGLRAVAEEVRLDAETTARTVRGVAWEGLAAEAAVAAARAGCDRLGRTVAALLDAADAVDRHAAAVERRLDGLLGLLP